MKTKQKQNDRSGAKWLPGAMAVAAATGATQAATVQITLSGNTLSTGVDNLNLDLTGDGNDDFASAVVDSTFLGYGVYLRANVGFGPVIAGASFGFYTGKFGVALGATPWTTSSTPQVGTGFVTPIKFTDSAINGGLETTGWLEIFAENLSTTNQRITLSRLVFDDADTAAPPSFNVNDPAFAEFAAVPEPGVPALCLLALGAGCLLDRRRKKSA